MKIHTFVASLALAVSIVFGLAGCSQMSSHQDPGTQITVGGQTAGPLLGK